jgi:hypothetical protein
MCFGTFTSSVFIRDLSMVLYLGGGTKQSIKLFQIKKKVIRLIAGINKYEFCRQKFKENRILTVPSVYVLGVLCYIKKLTHNCEIHEYNTRSKCDLHTQSHNTSLLQNSVLHVGVRLYKCLPLKIKKKLDSFNQFRKEVKLTLLNNSFYTLEELLQAKLVCRYTIGSYP